MAIEIAAHRIAYMALPKAGCTTVKRSLARADPEFAHKAAKIDPAQAAGTTACVHRVYPTRRFRPHRWEKYDTGWYRFAVVRDPVERLISCYGDRVVKRRELHNSPKIKRAQGTLPADPDPDFFCQNLRAYQGASSAVRHHTPPVWLFLGPWIARFDDVFPIERLHACLNHIAYRTDTALPALRANKSGVAFGLDDLSAQTRHVLARTLAREYADLARWYDNPFA